jgi:hypothetical protein
MTTPADQGPARPASISPDRLTRLLNGAVQAVTTPPGAYDRIQQGVRRRRSVRRASAALLAVAALAGGGAATLVAAAGSAPAQLGAAAALPYPEPVLATPTADVSPGGPVVIRRVGNAMMTSRFVLMVRTVSSGTQSVPFTAVPVVVGSADAAGNGAAEIFVQVDEGGGKQFWTIFRLVNGQLTQVQMSGRPVELAVGGTVLGHSWFSCNSAAGELVIYGYRTGGTSLVTGTYRWAGASLVLVSKQHTTLRGPWPAEYTGVSCGGLPQSAA